VHIGATSAFTIIHQLFASNFTSTLPAVDANKAAAVAKLQMLGNFWPCHSESQRDAHQACHIVSLTVLYGQVLGTTNQATHPARKCFGMVESACRGTE